MHINFTDPTKESLDTNDQPSLCIPKPISNVPTASATQGNAIVPGSVTASVVVLIIIIIIIVSITTLAVVIARHRRSAKKADLHSSEIQPNSNFGETCTHDNSNNIYLLLSQEQGAHLINKQ